jgi:hypothetical protein
MCCSLRIENSKKITFLCECFCCFKRTFQEKGNLSTAIFDCLFTAHQLLSDNNLERPDIF